MSPATESRFGHARFGAPAPEAPVPPDPQPVPTKKSRRTLWISLAVIGGLVGAFLGGLALGGSGRVQVWKVRHDLAAGSLIRPADLEAVSVSTAAAQGIARSSSRSAVRTTPRDLQAGQLLPDDLPEGVVPVPTSGEVLVGIAAPPGTAPDGLRAGDPVGILGLPPTTTPPSTEPVRIIIGRVEVYSVNNASSGRVVTVIVPTTRANVIAALNAQQRIALVQQPS